MGGGTFVAKDELACAPEYNSSLPLSSSHHLAITTGPIWPIRLASKGRTAVRAGTRLLLAVLLTMSYAGASRACNESFGCGSPASLTGGFLFRPDTRQLALGGAGVASANRYASAYYNPALVAWQNRRTLNGATYYKILQNFNLNSMYYFHSSTSLQLGSPGALALAVTYVNLGEQERTDESGTLLGKFTTYSLLIGGSYSRKIGENTSVGLTLKWFHDHLADAGYGSERGEPTGRGFAVDIGALHRLMPSLSISAALRNYGPNVKYAEQYREVVLPLSFDLGADWEALQWNRHRVTVVAELSKPLAMEYHKPWYLAPIRGWYDEEVYKIDPATRDTEEKIYRSIWKEESRQVDIHAGVEYSYAEYVALRAGYFRDWDHRQTWLPHGAGASWSLGPTKIEAAYSRIHSVYDASQDPDHGRYSYSLSVSL
jgi:hypothetical protein